MKRVLLVDDHAAFRKALVLVLGHSPGLEAAGEAGTVDEGLRAATGDEPYDVAVVDLLLPDGNGAEVVRALRGARPDLPILVLSASSETDEALAAGADEAIPKETPLARIVATIRRLAENREAEDREAEDRGAASRESERP